MRRFLFMRGLPRPPSRLPQLLLLPLLLLLCFVYLMDTNVSEEAKTYSRRTHNRGSQAQGSHLKARPGAETASDAVFFKAVKRPAQVESSGVGDMKAFERPSQVEASGVEEIGFIKAVKRPPQLLEARGAEEKASVKAFERPPVRYGEGKASDAFVPVQENPWLGDDDDERILETTDFTLGSVDGCNYRDFVNISLFSRPDFIQEYAEFKECMGVDPKDWTRRRISARLGNRSQLMVETDFRYGIDVDLCAKTPKLLFLVLSTCDHFEWREAVRKSWGNNLPEGQKVMFFMGKDKLCKHDLMKEVNEFDDVVRSDVDGRDAAEQVFSALAWVHRRCPLAQFLVLVAEDAYVNTARFTLFTHQESGSANRMYGALLRHMTPDRHTDSHSTAGTHPVTTAEWPWSNLPPFLAGPSLVLTGDVVPRLLAAAPAAPALPSLPAVYVGGLVPLVNRVMRIGVAEFFVDSPPDDTGEDEDECVYAKHGVIERVSSPRQLMRIHDQVTDVQVMRNLTCTISPKCKVKVDGKCMFFAQKEKKKSRKKHPLP